MGIIKWLKMQFYIPQINKAEKNVTGHRFYAKCLEEKPREKRSKKEQSTIEYNYAMADIWQEELEKLEYKMSKIEYT
jgi:hypothetical protein